MTFSFKRLKKLVVKRARRDIDQDESILAAVYCVPEGSSSGIFGSIPFIGDLAVSLLPKIWEKKKRKQST